MNKIQTDSDWVLVAVSSEQSQQSMTIPAADCIVGRSVNADLRIKDSSISKSHARLYLDDNGSLFVEDLGSTNGTFVNGEPANRTALSSGDLVQFANIVYRLEDQATDMEIECTLEEIPLDWANKLIGFDRLMSERAVTPLYQPIVSMDTGETVAFEMLACSQLEDLETAASIFGTAEILNQEAALSELLREVGARVASQSEHNDKRFYFNIDPVEFGTSRLNDSLAKLREQYPTLKLTLEVHEKAVTKIDVLRAFHRTLLSLNIHLGYDDFGAGQGRLLELTEVPPDVVKFDMRLIRGIDTASSTRKELLRSLVKAASKCGTLSLAECVETKQEHDACVELGFDLGQGFYYGRPAEFSQ